MSYHDGERPGFWIWVAVHAEMIPVWSWPVLILIEAIIIVQAQAFR